jgi:hypothetical protein
LRKAVAGAGAAPGLVAVFLSYFITGSLPG